MSRSARLILAWLTAACGGATDVPLVTPSAATTQREIAVSFESDGATSGRATLCGTLSLPPGGGPSPGVVLLHGSGAHDRNQPLGSVLMLDLPADQLDGRLDAVLVFNEPLRAFSDLASHLAGEGFAVLRFDKRNHLAINGSPCGPRPPFPPQVATPDDFVADGAAALRFLSSRSEVDPRRLYVIGHSEGATYAALLASREPRLCGAVGLAGTARPIDKVVLEQLDRIVAYLRALPAGEPRDRLLFEWTAARDQLTAQLARVRAGTASPDEVILGASARFWSRWIALFEETAQALPAVGQPLLFVRGSLDFNVSAEDLASFRPADGATLLTVDALTHAMNEVTTAGYSEHVSAGLLRALVEWLRAHPC